MLVFLQMSAVYQSLHSRCFNELLHPDWQPSSRAQFLCNASNSVSGVIGDLLSPARMIIFGTLLTTINKPMFALSGGVTAVFGTTAALYWITFGKVWYSSMRPLRC